MPSATRTTILRLARPARASAQVVEHPLGLGLRRAARRGKHLPKQVAGTVLVADALELLGQLELARERIRLAVVLDELSVDAAAGGVLRLVEVEADAREVEGERRVAGVGARPRRVVRRERHLRGRLLEAG